MAVSTHGVKVAATERVTAATLLLQMALDRKRAGADLAALREEQRTTQADLVTATGLSLRQIQRYEAGESMPRWKNLDKLAEALGPKVYEIVHDDAERPATPDVVGALDFDPYAEQLDRIEEKLDEIIKRLPPAADDETQEPEPTVPDRLPDDPDVQPGDSAQAG